ncbi:MAG: 16S rRNA (guanine(966)-N(2))-methyltransferase RsmD [Desulfobacteraceae bacterium]|nr:MAG: 16S rRNA (guanine(966)-N(2))-methyltransferase RsmD [Desulfobacteraceae bacterium]
MGLRIISGDLKGKKLLSPKGMRIRPTADRLRESIFSILSDRVSGSVVLDLFAGTGALGIEALSRGALFALFVDNDTEALLIIKKNIEICGLRARIKIARLNIERNFIDFRHMFANANLVFMDPPYNKNLIRPALENLSESRILENEALLVIEHNLLEKIPEEIPGYKLEDQRRYGKTLVSFIKYML